MNPYEQPPRGAEPVDETLTPQIGTSVLLDSALPSAQPQVGTTVLPSSVFPKEDNLSTHTSILGESTLPKIAPPRVSMLGESTLTTQKPQRQTSMLPTDLLPSIPPPKMPRLVKDREKPEQK